MAVLGAILQEAPREEDVSMLLDLLDDDKSGVIEFQVPFFPMVI